MGLLTQRKEHKVPDLSRYDYYYQRKDDYNKSPRLSAAAAYAASRSRGNPVLVQQRSQSLTQPRRVVRTRPRTKSRGAVEAREAREAPRADSIMRDANFQDTKGTKSITRRTIRRINGVDYMETVTTTPLEDEDNARHFNEFSEPVDNYADEHPVRRVRRVKKTAPSSPKSVRSTRTQRGPISPPRSPVRYHRPEDYQYEEPAQAESEFAPPAPAPVRRTTSTTRPVRSRSTRSVRKAGSVPQSAVVANAAGERRLTEQEMYARALEIAQRNVYSGSDFSPDVLDSASSQDGQAPSRMGQRSLRRDSGRGKKKFTLFNKDRDAGAAGALPAADAPRASGASSLDNRLGQNVEPTAVSASTASRRNLSDEEMYGQALAMSQNKSQRNVEEPESGTQPLNLGGVEKDVRSPQSNAAASFVTPAQTIDENYEENFEDAKNYDGEWKDARPKGGAYGNYDYPVENGDRYDFEEPEPEAEPEYIEPELEREYVDPERLPKAAPEYEPEYQTEEVYEPVYEKREERAPIKRNVSGYSRRSGVAQDEALQQPKRSGSGYSRRSGIAQDGALQQPRRSVSGYSGRSGLASGLASPIDTTKSGFSNPIASPEEVRAGDLQAAGANNVGASARSPLRSQVGKQQTVQSPIQSPLEDSAARGGFDSEAELGGLGGAAAAGGVEPASRRKSKGFSSGLSRFKTRKSLFGGKPDEQPLPDLPKTDLTQAGAEDSEIGYSPAHKAQQYEGKTSESRPKNKLKSMLNKVVEFGAENSGYQPPRGVKEQQKAEKTGAGFLREGEGSVPYTKHQRGASLGNGVGAGGVTTDGGLATDGPAAVDSTTAKYGVVDDGTAAHAPAVGSGAATRGPSARVPSARGPATAGAATTGATTGPTIGTTAGPTTGATTGDVAAGTTAGAAAGGVGKRSGGGSHPWRRNAQPASATDGGVASGKAPAASSAQQPNNHLGTAAPGLEETSESSNYDTEHVVDEGFADGYADGLRDSQYESGYDRAGRAEGTEKANGLGGSAAAADVAGEGGQEGMGYRQGVQDKLNQAKDSSWGQKVIGKTKEEAQGQAKEQKGNLFKKLFKK
ncbi:hypothetical protein ZYGR_0A04310 [Zygosaccharomyces rouxii]|uniref:Meiotic sister-chromatid recombination protein 3 n=1 Tax=Zygosaccharomyces rouxii TaxID=4956 RepID=A0A1Q2ZU63_ZYGRO|nr:hypothetical protein ZYGR_0A04310 [Zygosaccharomyces rouxii]